MRAAADGESWLELLAEESDMDSLGHLNNAAYVRMFERGRIAFYREARVALETTTPPRLGTVVVNLNVNFKAECVAGDRLRLATRGLRRGRHSFVLAQRMTRPDGTPVADATVTSVIMDLDSRRVVALPAPLAAALPPPSGTQQPGSSEETT